MLLFELPLSPQHEPLCLKVETNNKFRFTCFMYIIDTFKSFSRVSERVRYNGPYFLVATHPQQSHDPKL